MITNSCANSDLGGRFNYLLFPELLFPALLLLPPDLLEDLEEKSLVMNSDTSGSSWLEFSMFIDCSISRLISGSLVLTTLGKSTNISNGRTIIITIGFMRKSVHPQDSLFIKYEGGPEDFIWSGYGSLTTSEGLM